MIFGFSKSEGRAVTIILASLVIISSLNLVVSLRRSRDVQRKADVRLIINLVEGYQKEFGFLPLSKDGKPYVKTGELFDNVAVYEVCQWGYECLPDLGEQSSPAYLGRLPVDPDNSDGVGYYMISNGRRVQVYAALEGHDEYGYDPKIIARNLACGNKICNYGIATNETPVDQSLEDYEEEIRLKDLKEKGLLP